MVGFLNAKEIDFNQDIRPILSDRCFHCHGPDAHERKGKLRLDIPHGPDGAFRTKKGSTAISPSNLDKSEIWQRIITDDEDDVMPPLDSHKKPLDAKEKELVKAWILQGAKWQSHWAFAKPVQKKTQDFKTDPWVINEIDQFILHRLKKSGLEPQPESSKTQLIRRVSLDLTGLPPSPEEIKAFLYDNSNNAYENMLDQYLDSPHYGERMAQAWMDASRYGDTSVYHADGPRTMWPWRDWVIESYNNNLPFDEFTKLQIAGDYYENKEADPSRLATAFLRNNGTTDEGGAFDEEYRVEYAVDRLSTVSQIWLGLTMECAQCHDHKYDPISQKEFFQLYAFFNVSADKGLQTRRGNAFPTTPVQLNHDETIAYNNFQKEIDQIDQNIKTYKQQNHSSALDWISKTSTKTSNVLVDGLVHYYPLDEAGGKTLVDPLQTSDKGQLEGRFQKTNPKDKHNGLKLDGKTNYKFKNTGSFIDNNTPFSYGAWVKMNSLGGFQAPFARMDSNHHYRGFDLFVSGGAFGIHLINTWPSNAIKIQSKQKIPAKKWVHLFVTYDGSSKATGFKLYQDGKEVPFSTLTDKLDQTTKTEVPFRIGRREVGAAFNQEVDDIKIFNKVLTPKDINLIMNFNAVDTVLSSTKNNQKDTQAYLVNHYFNTIDKKHPAMVKSKGAKIKAQKDLKSKTVMVMKDQPQMRKTYVLNRGQYDQPIKDEVIPMGVPAILPPMDENAPKNRLGLAQWLLNLEHPLTSRVTVNRYWTMIFGEGLVKSVTDFGSQGTWPTHPELLDWLAVEFQKKNWNTKAILKTIMMSATYRQSSAASTVSLEKDPDNSMLSRGPRFRLQGDFIRDLTLKASGLLVDKIGGKGVKPYQPAGLWAEVALGRQKQLFYQDKGDKNFRRSLYTYWKRSSPPPNMRTFDAPTREKCVIKRARTNTPLQALVTLNDPQFIETSRVFGERIMVEGGKSMDERIDYAYQWVTAQKPSLQTKNKIKQLYQQQLDTFKKNPERVQDFLKVGTAPVNESLDPSEHAAWAVIGSLLFNLDETLTKG